MQTWQILLIALAGVAVLGTTTMFLMGTAKDPMSSYSPEVIAAFKAWQIKYNKKETDPDVAAYRLGIFNKNYETIKNHSGKTYTLGENQFMDLTNAEFKATYLGLLPKKTMSKNVHKHSMKLPAASVDWRTKGAVSAIKDQGQCGSCWAFSTTGSLESVDKLEGTGLGDFSEQQLVDCSQSYGNMGCNGGLMDYAFQYVIDNGITTEQKYPYTATDGNCRYTESMKAFQISKFTDVSSGSCADLTDAVNQQPVSIGVDAETWQFYSGGVFSDCGDQLDHGVLAVGYDTKGDWTVKNSWGTSWGMQGYITLKNGNTCGICNTASYPSV